MRIRRVIDGLVQGFPGQNSVLAQILRAFFTNEKQVYVSRHVKKAEFNIHVIDDSVMMADVTDAVTRLSSCDMEAVSTVNVS